MSKEPTLIPVPVTKKVDGTIFKATVLWLANSTPPEVEEELHATIERETRQFQTDLVVLDIVAGEPEFLARVLKRFAGFGAPVILVPESFARPETLAAAELARPDNALLIAEKLGYLNV